MVRIAENKNTEYEIIYPSDATPSVKTAVSELKKYLFKITGAILCEFTECRHEKETEIVVGYTNRGGYDDELVSRLGDEGFEIKTEGEKIFILGSGVRGALYGVYTFLEKYCGCLFMTNDYEKIPRRSTLDVGMIDDEEIPVFMSRNSYWYPVRKEGISAKLKINGCSDRTLSERVGGGVYYAGDFQHTLGYLSEQCPEGERAWVQPCLSDENVYQTVLKNVRRKLKECPHAKIMSITQNDGDSGACKCDKCRAVNEREESEMGTMLAFVNRIARELKDEYPDVLFDTFAYRFTRKPPKTIMPEDNVIVRLCSIECCFRHAHEDCHETPGHEEPSEPFSDQLIEWARRTKHLFIWDYTTDFTNYATSFMNIPILRKNVEFFARNGAEGVFEQGNIFCPNGEFGELKGYLLARLLWNPYMTEKEYSDEIDRFCEGYYGKGGRFIRELIDYMAECSKDSHFGIYFDNASIYIKPAGFASELEAKFEYIRRAEEFYEKARELAETDEETAHINCSEIQLYNYKFFVYNQIKDETKDDPERRAEYDAACEKIIENNKIIFKLMKMYGMVCPREFIWMDKVDEPDWMQCPLLWENPKC